MMQLVDLKSQYLRIKKEIDTAMLNCVASTRYIKGPEVQLFETALAEYLGAGHAVGCGNGTDALQIALMALDLQPGDEVIVPAFTYVATAEAIALLKLKPRMVDVDPVTFNMATDDLENEITSQTKAIVPVHLYGQAAPMEPIMNVAQKYGLFVIEDNAQALGAEYTFSSGKSQKTGTIGHIGCNSFFPTKNLGCFGDGGAITTNDATLAEKCRMIAAHGQKKKYYHEIIGCNSRLDTLQAAVLNVKLKYLDDYIAARRAAAAYYTSRLRKKGLTLPLMAPYARHAFNQFTLVVHDGKRDALQAFLKEKGIPSIIYYPLPLYRQPAFERFVPDGFLLPDTEMLCNSVLSIPMHTELTPQIQDEVIAALEAF